MMPARIRGETKPRIVRKHREWFAVKCEACGETFFFSRPRRVLGWLPLPEGHGPGRPCQGSFRVLHHGERRAALRAREST
jgi:hypothetical protein